MSDSDPKVLTTKKQSLDDLKRASAVAELERLGGDLELYTPLLANPAYKALAVKMVTLGTEYGEYALDGTPESARSLTGKLSANELAQRRMAVLEVASLLPNYVKWVEGRIEALKKQI